MEASAGAKKASGTSLVREADRLDLAARRVGVAALTHFLSENQSVLIEKMRADGFDPSKMRVPPEQWFEASDGLAAVRAIAAHVHANLNDFKQPNPILRDLKAVEAILAAAESAGVRFHLTRQET